MGTALPVATASDPDAGDLVVLGESVIGRPITAVPAGTHVLVSGATGSGKTTFARWLASELARIGYQIVVIDPKRVGYRMLEPVASVYTEPEEAVKVLQAANDEVERRYVAMARRGAEEFRPTADEHRVAVVVEEVAALTATASSKRQRDAILGLLSRYANLARGAGMLLVLVAQSPDARTIETSTRAACGIRVGLRNGREQWSMLTDGDEEALVRCQSVTRPGEILVSTPETPGWTQGAAFGLDGDEIRRRVEGFARLRGFPRDPGFLSFDRRPEPPS